MAAILDSYLGKVWLFDKNPRQIRDAAFDSLCESIERDEDFMRMRGVIVWLVPTALASGEGEKSPFEGQRGKFIVLCGNMRCLALKALGHKELKKEWLIEAKHPDGTWLTPDEAERLVLIDNETPGMSGTNDYAKMLENFNEQIMRMSGIDFSEFEGLMQGGTVSSPPLDGKDGDGKTLDEQVEEGDMGEKNPELQEFINEREKTRKNLKYIDETGFHLLLVFPGGFEQKAEFIAKSGAFGGRAVSSDASPYLDLVFESHDQKMAFAEAAGLNEENPETGVPPLMLGLFCDGREFAKKMGIDLKETGLHFRDRVKDSQLAEMAMPPMEQKSEKEIEEGIFAELKAERASLGMDTRQAGSKGGKKGGKKVTKGADDGQELA